MEPTRSYEAVVHGQRVQVRVYPALYQLSEPVCWDQEPLPQVDPTWLEGSDATED